MTSSTHVTSNATECVMTLTLRDKMSYGIVKISNMIVKMFVIISRVFACFHGQIYATPAQLYEKLRKNQRLTKLWMRTPLVRIKTEVEKIDGAERLLQTFTVRLYCVRNQSKPVYLWILFIAISLVRASDFVLQDTMLQLRIPSTKRRTRAQGVHYVIQFVFRVTSSR